MRSTITQTIGRPVIGAAAAVAVYVILQSGFFSFGPLTCAKVLAISFVAGFSERLVLRGVDLVAPDKQKPVGGGGSA